jgi:hypothetical protein
MQLVHGPEQSDDEVSTPVAGVPIVETLRAAPK